MIPDTQRLFYPGKQKNNEIFNEQNHKEIIYELYDAFAEIVPPPKPKPQASWFVSLETFILVSF